MAVVTGASRGLGRAIALALAGAGADVVLAARSKADLEETARRAAGTGRRALVAPTDVAVYAEVEALMARVKPFAEMSPDDWRFMMDVNLTGVFNGCRAAAPHLIAQRAGKIVNVASVMGQVGLPGYTVYAATKGGVIALTRTLGVEWARHGIQVNAIAPGWFATEMSDPAFSDPKLGERLRRDIPMRRIGRPEEIGPLAVYLAGQTIFLDGGHSAA